MKVHKPEKMCLYIDGKLSNSKRISGNPEWEEDGWNWNGLIDDVRIYSYALSAEEIKDLYEGKEPPLEKKSE